MKKNVITLGAAIIFCLAIFLNFDQYSSMQNTDIGLTELLSMNNANAETWTECTNCKAQGYYCNGNWQYKCVLGGTSCNVSGQEPC